MSTFNTLLLSGGAFLTTDLRNVLSAKDTAGTSHFVLDSLSATVSPYVVGLAGNFTQSLSGGVLSSATANGSTLRIRTTYHGQTFGLATRHRLTSHFTYNSAAVAQVLSAGFVSGDYTPENSRLHTLGYF